MDQKRFGVLLEHLRREGHDAILIVPSEDLVWLAGTRPHLCERFQGLFIKPDGSHFYFCNRLTQEEAVEMFGADHVHVWHDNESMTDRLREVMKAYGLLDAAVAVNAAARAFNILEIRQRIGIDFINGKEFFETVTMLKTPSERERLRRASTLTDAVMEAVWKQIRPGMTEGEIADRVRQEFIRRGAVPDFAIVARGPHTAMPHYQGTQGVVQERDVVLLDIGCVLDGLKSDMTRTVFVGEPDPEMARVYDLVLAAQTAALEAIDGGVSVSELDRTARRIITDGGYEDAFTTRLGHGIGYSTHEAPYIVQTSNRVLSPGMAFSIEPGIYLQGRFGVRIEDLVLMNEDGPEVLNRLTKALTIL